MPYMRERRIQKVKKKGTLGEPARPGGHPSLRLQDMPQAFSGQQGRCDCSDHYIYFFPDPGGSGCLAELTLLRDQLQHSTATQPSPKTSPTAARSLLGWVGFSPGSVEVNAKGVQTLAAIATRSIQTPGARLLVEGTADSSPLGAQTAARYEDNLGLSLARVLSVFRVLRELGVERERMGMAVSGQANSGKDDERTVGVWLIAAN